MNMNIKQGALFYALLLPLAAGCASTHDSFSSSGGAVPDGLLQYASDDHRTDVDTARAEHNAALDRLEAARHDHLRTEAQNDVFREQVALAEQRVDVERARVDARSTGETTEFETAQAQQLEAEKQVEAAERQLELNARRVNVSEAEIAVAEAEVSLAARRVELAKARAVAPLDRPEVSEIDVADFEADVREEETKLELAKVERDAAQRELEIFDEKVGNQEAFRTDVNTRNAGSDRTDGNERNDVDDRDADSARNDSNSPNQQ